MTPTPQQIAETCLGHASRVASRSVTRVFNACLRPHDLQVTQFAILLAIADARGGATVAAIAQRIDIERSAATRAVQILERRGLVGVDGGPGRGGKRVVLTTAGQAALGTCLDGWRRAQTMLRAELGDGDADRALDALRTLERAASRIEARLKPRTDDKARMTCDG
ncbi:MAG: MarR family winged helix-turn-helix transcriptional regulator [Inquilinaceae bacterium]